MSNERALRATLPAMPLESDLYAPVKALLEGQGYVVKGEVRGCDVVAVCQRNVEAARLIAAKYGVPQVFWRWEELLEKARPGSPARMYAALRPS